MQDVVTVEHAAARLKLHPKTVLRAIREGRLKAVRVGKSYRILRSDLDAFAGVPARAPQARVTAVLDVHGAGRDLGERLMSRIPAVLNGRTPGGPPLRADVVFDPETGGLKVIVVGDPADAARLLGMIPIWLEG